MDSFQRIEVEKQLFGINRQNKEEVWFQEVIILLILKYLIWFELKLIFDWFNVYSPLYLESFSCECSDWRHWLVLIRFLMLKAVTSTPACMLIIHQRFLNKFPLDFDWYDPPVLNRNIFPHLIVFPLFW
jgi:hypothetical protein